MEDNGIAWMIAGGVRAESLEDQRQRQQRAEVAHLAPERNDTVLQLRQRLTAIVGGGPAASASPSADCCPA